MNPDDENEELQLFRQKWKEELRKDLSDGIKTNCSSDEGNQRRWQTNRKRNVPGLFHCFGEEMRQSGDEMDPVDCLKSRDKSLQMPEGKSVGPFAKENNGIVLLNLPEPITRNACNNTSDCKIQQSKIAISTVRSKKSLLEQLIDDINEITSIPFFDLSLPKEVGIQIFNHLRVKDLCACAQVSKSWKILSEDELIWYRVGCKLGYIQERDSAAIDRANWKAFVREHILEERELRRNWKERMCRLSSMEFERGRSLSAVSIHGDLICSGYSSGAVVIWKGSIDGASSYRELDTTDDTQRQKPLVASTAIHNTLCAAGFDNGDVYVWHTSLGSSPLCHCRCEGSVKSVSLATSGPLTFAAVSDHDLQVQLSDSNGQWTCLESRNFEDKIGQAMFIPSSSTGSSSEHVAIATQDTVSVMAPGKGFLSTLDHVIGGKLSCMDCTADRLAVGVGSYGYGTLGNKVRLYCLDTTKMISILGTHHREITCLDVVSCPPHRLVTGSYDCRVRVFDLRTEKMALSFHLGHKRAVTAVQMDDWKVVSGAEDGTLLVWDQRMTSALWMTHARHPVRLCKLQGSRMITANIPADKSPRENLWYADDLILHRRHRGVIRMFDFSVNNETEGIPDICSSNYDDTSGYNYNIKLSVPYDSIEL